MTQETLEIEQAAARHILRVATQRMLDRWPDVKLSFDRVFISGAVLSQAPSPAQTLMMILDGIQPVGVGTFLLDSHGLTQALGAIAATNTVLPVQVLDGAYLNLGTVIAPLSEAKKGAMIMRIQIKYDEGGDTRVEVKQGTLITLPIRYGQVATLSIDTLRGTLLDPTRPRLRSFKVVGGACGVVVDARGRPLTLPSDGEKRRDLLERWAHALEERRLV
jgi:hypothetical protein